MWSTCFECTRFDIKSINTHPTNFASHTHKHRQHPQVNNCLRIGIQVHEHSPQMPCHLGIASLSVAPEGAEKLEGLHVGTTRGVRLKALQRSVYDSATCLGSCGDLTLTLGDAPGREKDTLFWQWLDNISCNTQHSARHILSVLSAAAPIPFFHRIGRKDVLLWWGKPRQCHLVPPSGGPCTFC